MSVSKLATFPREATAWKDAASSGKGRGGKSSLGTSPKMHGGQHTGVSVCCPLAAGQEFTASSY